MRRKLPSSVRSVRVVENDLGKARVAIRYKPHDLVSARIDPEPCKKGERRIEQTHQAESEVFGNSDAHPLRPRAIKR